jgi:hypothetical protein
VHFPSWLPLLSPILALPLLCLEGACEDRPLVLDPAVFAVDAGTPPRVVACQRWEYKVLVVEAPTHETTGPNATATNEIPISEVELNGYGNNSWELATSWLEPETSFPHGGSNIRPGRAVLLFKRCTK